jgi:hypothetical protein
MQENRVSRKTGAGTNNALTPSDHLALADARNYQKIATLVAD